MDKTSLGNIYLAADSGGSKTIFRLVDEKGTVLTEVKTEGMGAVRAGVLPIRDIIKTAKEKIDIFGKPKAIFLSLGGPNTKEVYDELSTAWKNIPVEVEREACGNSILRAAKYLGCSSVVMCGTGSTAVGFKNNKKVFAGGWGPIYGDGGSGGGIGSEALKKFLRHLDGFDDIGELSQIFSDVTDGLDIEKFEDRMEAKQRALDISRRELAALAPQIYLLALKGNKCAKELYANAAQEIALMADAVCDNDKKSAVLICGGFFKNKPEFVSQCVKEFSQKNAATLIYNEFFSPIAAATISVLVSNTDADEKVIRKIINGGTV